MKKMSENESFALTGITPVEMEVIKNAFTLLVRQTDNEMANSLLNVIKSELEVEKEETTSAGKRVTLRRKKIQMRQ